MAGENGVSSAVVKGLAAHLKSKISELTAVYDDFPSPSQKLDYPSITIFTKNPGFMPGAPYVVAKSDTPDSDNNYLITKSIGDYVFKLQVDVWVGSKFARHAIYEKVFRALNPESATAGVTLVLPDYFDENAHYHITDFDFTDSEVGAQTQEWRVMVEVTVDVRAIVQELGHLITEVENNVEITNEELPAEQDSTVELTI